MQTHEFEDVVIKHSLCPDKKLYNAVALAGEVGEICNNLKKMHMANQMPEWVQRAHERSLMPADHFKVIMIDELGDALFYLTRVALDAGTDLQSIMLLQQTKLDQQSSDYQRTFLK